MSHTIRIGLVFSITTALASVGSLGCDRFEPPAGGAPPADSAAADARTKARASLTAIMTAAQTATATCVASDLRWEADVDGLTVPRHFSRPCIPERCEPKPEEVDALRTATRATKILIDGDPHLRVPSFQGFLALAEAMVAFTDTAIAGRASASEKEKPLRLSGLSMHYASLAAAFHEIYPDADVPREPPSLVKSLEGPQPGGDPCKGWARPEYCDVSAVTVPKERRWRTDPACIEVQGVPK